MAVALRCAVVRPVVRRELLLERRVLALERRVQLLERRVLVWVAMCLVLLLALSVRANLRLLVLTTIEL